MSNEEGYIYKIKEMPPGISIFLVFFLILEIYYYFIDYFVYGLYNHYGYTIESLGNVLYLLITLFIFTVVLISLYLIILGFINRENWARKFAIVYIIWAMLWPLWALIIAKRPAFNITLLIIYLLSIVYLMTSYVIEYFKKVEVFVYMGYTLYSKEVTLVNGKTLTIYFFSKHEPHSGTPCPMPEGYEVGINERSNMPYLRKAGKPEQYKYGKYKLYTRKVELKNGRIVTIYFFSIKKPHSGTPCPLPDGYAVRTSDRSNLPYLIKKEHLNKKKNKKESKTKTEKETSKKPSNVIYVVSSPQPGQVKGDWAVRSHGKIYSHHRKKETAIKEAKKIARKKDATVMIQKTDGTFSEGIKPKKK
jgi:hypothetical protein